MISWAGLVLSHLHPALALVFVVPFLPHKPQNNKGPVGYSALKSFEHDWKAFVEFGLFAFGLTNAGVAFSRMGQATWLVLASLFFGKLLGIGGFGYAAVKVGYPFPDGMNFRDVLLVGFIGGIGFTVSLFVAGEAFGDPAIQDQARMGALLSIGISLMAFVAGHILRQRRVPAVEVHDRQSA